MLTFLRNYTLFRCWNLKLHGLRTPSLCIPFMTQRLGGRNDQRRYIHCCECFSYMSQQLMLTRCVSTAYLKGCLKISKWQERLFSLPLPAPSLTRAHLVLNHCVGIRWHTVLPIICNPHPCLLFFNCFQLKRISFPSGIFWSGIFWSPSILILSMLL